MDNVTDLRDAIEEAAEKRGAKRVAIFKWRKRGVPAEWKLKLLSDPEVPFSLDDFRRVDEFAQRSKVEANQ